MIGAQTPRIFHAPKGVSPAGREAIELAAFAGLKLDPWQQFVLSYGLAEQPNGLWAAFEVAVVACRQNGKNGIFEARELAGLYLLGERMIVHTAHLFDTSLEAFRRLLELIESRDEFTKRVKRISRSHGEEGVELYGPKARRMTGGQRIRFRTRTKGGGRGFSGDLLVDDEAMILPTTFNDATLPILSARPNPQVWYGASAVDQQVHEDGAVLTGLRERALAEDGGSLIYAEWSVDHDDPSSVPDELAGDPAVWAIANPALGIRIKEQHIRHERAAMSARGFAVERLGIGDWPDISEGESVLNIDRWLGLADEASLLLDPICLAFDVSPRREYAAISAAGERKDRLHHLETIEHRRGVNWVVPHLVELKAKHGVIAVVCDGASPAASLVPALEAAGVTVKLASAKDYAAACGMIQDAVEYSTLRHLGTRDLTVAIRSAEKRPLAGADAWSRKASGADITPLVAGTLALWGFVTAERTPEPWAVLR